MEIELSDNGKSVLGVENLREERNGEQIKFGVEKRIELFSP